MNNRTRRCARILAALAVLGSCACKVSTAPPPAGSPEPASTPPPAATPAPKPKAPPAGSPPAESRFEDNVNRPGGDLRSFSMPQGGPEACAAACEKEPGCYAYTYVKAEQAHHGVAECALKHNVPMANKSECCVSGVIRPWP